MRLTFQKEPILSNCVAVSTLSRGDPRDHDNLELLATHMPFRQTFRKAPVHTLRSSISSNITQRIPTLGLGGATLERPCHSYMPSQSGLPGRYVNLGGCSPYISILTPSQSLIDLRNCCQSGSRVPVSYPHTAWIARS